jgi:hypothetical protein
MNEKDFLHWLSGFFELGDPKTLNEAQIKLIREKISQVKAGGEVVSHSGENLSLKSSFFPISGGMVKSDSILPVHTILTC